MTRSRAKKEQPKQTPVSKSTLKYGCAAVIIFIIIAASIFAFTTQQNMPSSTSSQPGRWLFAMDTPSEAVGSRSAYSTGYIPTLVIIDPDGNIVHRQAGVHTKQQLLEFINKIADGSAEILGAAPDFSLTTFNDEKFKLSVYRGKTVILDFMAVRCPPCHQQMPELQAIKEEKGDDIVILSIDVDGAYSQETEQDVKNTFEEYIKY
ncbi:MAG: TlpA family protein disulfide reductase [Petrotogales bacterium]